MPSHPLYDTAVFQILDENLRAHGVTQSVAEHYFKIAYWCATYLRDAPDGHVEILLAAPRADHAQLLFRLGRVFTAGIAIEEDPENPQYTWVHYFVDPKAVRHHPLAALIHDANGMEQRLRTRTTSPRMIARVFENLYRNLLYFEGVAARRGG